jgi:hypothetical protein
MAYLPVAGSWGRVKLVKVAPDLTTPVYSWSGTTASVRLTSWRARESKAGGTPSVLDFESTADAEGVLYPLPIRGGTAEMPTIDVEGNADIDATTGTLTILPMHAAVVADFLIFKTGTIGYVGVPCVVQSFEIGGKVDDKTFTFRATFVAGAPLKNYIDVTP